jgi:hypothetical protein
VEGVGWVAAVGARIGQRADDVEELRNRSWPAMGEEQWDGLRLGRADMQEMDPLPIDRRGELGKVLSRASQARQS